MKNKFKVILLAFFLFTTLCPSIEAKILSTSNPDNYSNLLYTESNSTNTLENYISGHLTWEDDKGIIHPLQFVKVELYFTLLGMDLCMNTTYTSENGDYVLNYSKNDIMQQFITKLFIRVSPASDNVTVCNSMSVPYYCDILVIGALTGVIQTTPYDYIFKMNDYIGQAFQISQAAITAARFAEEMSNSKMTSVSIIYPHNQSDKGCYYKRNDLAIYINEEIASNSNPNSYAAWDVIMHEYGHHVSYEFDIINSPGGWHRFGIDMADHYRAHVDGTNNQQCTCNANVANYSFSECKDKANRLVWSEGWATVFGIIAQRYYIDILPNISTVGNASFESRSLENTQKCYSESYELNIMEILWDLYDDYNSEEIHDEIALGYQKFWDLTTKSHAKTYYEFVQYFNANIEDKNLISALGKINSYYNFAPREFKSLNDLTEIAPTFTWCSINKESNYYFNFEYYIEVRSMNGSVLFESNTISLASGMGRYTFSQSDWTNILQKSNELYIYLYGGDRLSNKYNTELIYFKSEHIHQYTRYSRYSMSQHKSTCSCGEFIYEFHIWNAGMTKCILCSERPLIN